MDYKRYSIGDFLEVKSSWDASFSPDESHIAYLSNETGTAQIFLVSVDDYTIEQLTNFPDPITFVRFSPTQNIIVFGKADSGNEQVQLYHLDLVSRKITDLTASPNVRHDFGSWSRDGRRICFASNERNGRDFDVYVMNLETLEKRCVFKQGGWCVAEGFSPLGTYLVIRQKHSNAKSDLYLCNLETGEIEHITQSDSCVYYMGAQWLPDETGFFVIQDADREFNGLARYLLAERKFEYVLTPDWDVVSAVVCGKGNKIAVTVNEGGYQVMTLRDISTLKPLSYRIPNGNTYRVRFSESGSKITFNLGDSRRTSDIWVLDMVTKKSHQLTHSHQGVPADAMIEPTQIRFTSFDGLSVPAFIYTPKGAEPGTKLPVVIDIHGGPEAQHQPAFVPLIQYLVHCGYSVVAPNVRGSWGYGKTYMALDDKDKRMDSVKDIVALRDHIATIPYLDADKIALYGVSYGGFMVLACMAFFPKLWAAGVDVVGISNFVSFLQNTAPYRRALREAEYGSLQHDMELLQRISPINSIERIDAPLLLIHGANDPRVPLSEARQVVDRLRAIGIHVELLVYPDEGHGIAKLNNRLDAYAKVVDFLDNAMESK